VKPPPAPLVLQFRRTHSRKIRRDRGTNWPQREELVVQRGHQRGVFPHLSRSGPTSAKLSKRLLPAGCDRGAHQRPIELCGAAGPHGRLPAPSPPVAVVRLLALPAMPGPPSSRASAIILISAPLDVLPSCAGRKQIGPAPSLPRHATSPVRHPMPHHPAAEPASGSVQARCSSDHSPAWPCFGVWFIARAAHRRPSTRRRFAIR